MSLRVSNASYLGRLLHQQQQLPFAILHFDLASEEIGVWFWPVAQDGTRVTPDNFNSYRSTHVVFAPCCFCASEAPRNGYTETAIYVSLKGPHKGEYVAGCAYDKCDYLVNLERMYSRRGLLIDKYPLRQPGHPAPPTILHLPTGNRLAIYDADGQISTRFSRLRSALLPLPVTEPLVRRRELISNQFAALNSQLRPGLLENDFMKLFKKCRCGLVMTRGVFDCHICVVTAPVVMDVNKGDGPIIIDLTGDSDDE